MLLNNSLINFTCDVLSNELASQRNYVKDKFKNEWTSTNYAIGRFYRNTVKSNAIDSFLSVLPIALAATSIFPTHDELSKISRMGVLSSRISNKAIYFGQCDKVKVFFNDRKNHDKIATLFERSLDTFIQILLNIDDNYPCIQTLISFMFTLSLHANIHMEYGLFSRLSIIWGSRIKPKRGLYNNRYIHSQIATLDSYFSSDDEMPSLCLDNDFVLHEINQMTLYTDPEKYSTNHLKSVLNGKSVSNISSENAQSFFRYTLHTLKVMTYGNENILAMRLSWIYFLLNEELVPRKGQISDLRILVKNIPHEYEITNKSCKKLLINLGRVLNKH